jgi:hypothetical protein
MSASQSWESELKPSALRITVTRPVYSEESFAEQFMITEKLHTATSSVREKIKGIAKIVPKLCKCNVEVAISKCFPIIKWLPKYSPRKDCLADFTGGLTVGIMHIPQGNC